MPPLKADDQPPIPSAPPFNTDDLITFMQKLDVLPGKSCEAGINCENGAEYLLDQHGCDQIAVCTEHKVTWTHELNEGIANGWCICPECKGEFTRIRDIFDERPI